MATPRETLDRRTLLQGSATALACGIGGGLAPGEAGAAVEQKPAPGVVTGKGPGDFDFLTGEWTIKLRNFDTSGPDGHKVNEASATVHRVLNGMGSIEELRRGDGTMWGMGVRVWHPEEQAWADHWTSAQDGVVNPPQIGRFIDGEGIFLADDTADGKPVKIRAVWDRITPISCRWFQTMSRDGGKSWERSWYMEWTRFR